MRRSCAAIVSIAERQAAFHHENGIIHTGKSSGLLDRVLDMRLGMAVHPLAVAVLNRAGFPGRRGSAPKWKGRFRPADCRFLAMMPIGYLGYRFIEAPFLRLRRPYAIAEPRAG